MTRLVLPLSLIAFTALAGEKPCITHKPVTHDEDDRPVAVAITVGPQGSDYALKVDFNKTPWGDECKTRCANATVFLDTDSNKATGLKLQGNAAETGADLAITIQGFREYKESSAEATLKVKVRQFTEESTSLDQGVQLTELDQRSDPERLYAQGNTVYVLVDANIGNLPSASKLRVVYHPPETKPLEGNAKGLAAAGANRVEIFKQGRLTNPKKKNSDY